MRMLPTGTITLFFADIERSTALLRELGPERFGAALVEYRQLIRDAVTSHDGVEVDAEGDAFFAVFRSAREAVAAAGEAQSALNERRLHVRMGLHTGEPSSSTAITAGSTSTRRRGSPRPDTVGKF
jgi:class 3 adenylate cyclase